MMSGTSEAMRKAARRLFWGASQADAREASKVEVEREALEQRARIEAVLEVVDRLASLAELYVSDDEHREDIRRKHGESDYWAHAYCFGAAEALLEVASQIRYEHDKDFRRRLAKANAERRRVSALLDAEYGPRPPRSGGPLLYRLAPD